MTPRIFVISGCAASGLGVTARRLTALGAPCGHRDVFHPEAFQAGGTLYWPPSVAGDASWFAAPILGKLPEGSVVLHQVRHPLDTIAELYDVDFFDSPFEDVHFVQDFLPETRLGGPLVRCMRFWLEWNRMVEAAADYEDLRYHRFLHEQLDAQRLVELTAALGVPRSASAAAQVIDQITVESGSAKRNDLEWSDLPEGRLRGEVMEAARRYGYAA